ncbi:LysR family transcriptional regulator [Frankia sp. Mgl5]|uniref:LysR family transcriptional regulator n=1 Tax=Frankia sp. Mgl5 TaxID=2933793 RepID=UPI00200F3B38|nr:LysR family transcriptional regulator [Frankia sp. Mgl5]MCK9929224.1 LysR family transcriptional regulator [Frankia sp. Mgl5]
MELRQLEYFVAVAEERNFTRAAERSHVSQSGVSAQIRQLERDLGAELFDRSGRAATLTAAGEAALGCARAALAATAALRQAVGEVTGLIRGQLTVGMVTGCTVTPLFDALAGFRGAHPGVDVSLLEGNSDQLVSEVRAGTVDLALVGSAAPAPEGLGALTIVEERLVAAVQPGHTLAERPRTTLRDLCRHPIVCMPPGTGLRTVFDLACQARDLHPRIALQASAPDAIADLASRGLGVAVLSMSMAAAYGDRLIALPVNGLESPALLTFVWRAPASPAVRELLAHARRAFAVPDPDGPANGVPAPTRQTPT